MNNEIYLFDKDNFISLFHQRLTYFLIFGFNQLQMMKFFIPICLILTSCGGGNQSAEEIAKEWCDLINKDHQATDEVSKNKAHKALQKFESDIEEKYKNDEAFLEKVDEETDKCIDDSEGVKDYDGD